MSVCVNLLLRCRLVDEENVPAISDPLPSVPYSTALLPKVLQDASLPGGVEFTYGCRNCEWKGLGMCPYGLNGWNDKILEPEGICDERRAYLKGFYRGEKRDMTFTEWEADYNQGVAQKAFQQSYKRLEILRGEIDEQNKNIERMRSEGVAPDEDDFKKAQKHLKFLMKRFENEREFWHRLWKDLRNFQETRLNREAPKKVEVTHKDSLSLNDIHRVMRGDVVDAEFTEVKTDNREDVQKR